MFDFKNFFLPGRSQYTNKEILKEFEKLLVQVNPNIQNSSFYSSPNDEKESETIEVLKEEVLKEDIMPSQRNQEDAFEDESRDSQITQAFVPDEDIYQILEPEIMDDIRVDLEELSQLDIISAKWIKAETFDKIKDVLPKKEDSLEIKEEPLEITQEIKALAIFDDPEKAVAPLAESKVTKTEIFPHKKESSNLQKCAKVTGQILNNCTSEIFSGNLLPIVGPFKAKIPVVLSEFQIQLFLNSTIKLPESALEIKEIKKNVKLTQCLLLQEPGTVTNPGNLFIKGFIRKNIDYATSQCTNSEGVCGDIRHCTVDVPFNCVTTVTYQTLPLPILENSVSQFQFSRKEKLQGKGFSEKDQLLSGDMSEFNQISMEHFNELPYCEMISAKILEYDEFIEGSHPDNEEALIGEKEFEQIEEKMVLNLTLKLLQNQQVLLSPFQPPPPPIVPPKTVDQDDEMMKEESEGIESEEVSIIEEDSVQQGNSEDNIHCELDNIVKLQQAMEEFLDNDGFANTTKDCPKDYT
ncbi:CsxC family protein [Desulfotomaculum sp. 1211_IL3151]|uniref:CsxC family protein n=1 Tax=Desulfotomaculum sp. 1211_IL3151 TaxID=3084055 RepID=UPI002FD946E4